MNTITATNARSDLFNIIKRVIKGHVQTKITSKEGVAILISEEDYESLLETAELLSVPGLKDSIKKADKEIEKGDVVSLDDIDNV